MKLAVIAASGQLAAAIVNEAIRQLGSQPVSADDYINRQN
jgi:putative NADH-flavin reductase